MGNGTQGTPSVAPPQPGTTTEATPALPDKRKRECHTIDSNDESRGVCGYRFNGGEADDRHSRESCRAGGHLHCQVCLALEELGLDGGRG